MMLSVGERSRLKTDQQYLMGRVLSELKKQDKYNRGLVTAASFSKVLDDFGLNYGQPEVTKLLNYCNVTNDGFVLYKDLQNFFNPDTPRAKKAETDNFFLKENDLASSSKDSENVGDLPLLYDQQNMKEFLTRQTEEIRKAFSRWDRGIISDSAFCSVLQDDIGVPLTDEFRHAMAVFGPARNLTFQKLLTSLRIDNFLNKTSKQPRRKEDIHKLYTTREKDEAYTAANNRGHGFYTNQEKNGIHGKQSQPKKIQRNPITWDINFNSQGKFVSAPSDAMSSQSGGGDPISREDFVRNSIINFCDGRIGSWVFCQQLAEAGVRIGMELDRLIRLHESDNSVKVADFLWVITRAENRGEIDEISTMIAQSTGSKGSGKMEPSKDSTLPDPPPRDALTTPYATDYTLETKIASTVRKDQMETLNESAKKWKGGVVRSHKNSNTRSGGDIIAWRDTSDDPEMIHKTPFAMAAQQAIFGDSQGDIITWDGGAGSGDNNNNNNNDIDPNYSQSGASGSSPRSGGTQHFKGGERPAKRLVAPINPPRTPFGTDADKNTTLAEAGTMEFRAATADQGRRVY